MEEKDLYTTEQCECGLGDEYNCQEEMNLEDLLGQLSAEIPPIQLDDDTMEGICNSEAFGKGIGNVVEVCGSITALVNCGVSVKDAMDYILTTATMKHNYELQVLNNEYGLEIAKHQAIQLEKTQL